ncbi:hypothetical protein RN001_008183 [Aquatica leii]|uniref:CRAL-TRIO domain-containing protein n=1 Tax=Aquatica leii TaxID=1421715 RepID=A0AAN7SGG7_9COLE|nr:hypothetical protein RN001_008183 [Aquatica leii]
MEEKAVIEFNETPSKREETLKSLEGWLKENLHINLQRDTLWLLNFIRGCDFDTQQTQNMLKNYLTLKDFVPEIVDHQDPLLLDLQDVMQNRTIIPFGTPNIDCVIFRWSSVNPNKTKFSSYIKLGLMLYEIFMNESETIMIVGQCIIIDCQDLCFAHLKQYTLSTIRKLLNHVFNSIPMRVKHFYFINCNQLLQAIYRLFRPFFPNYIQKIVKFYGQDYSGIYTDIPRHFFPIEYGGDTSCIDDISIEWKTKFESYRDWFLKHENLTTDF